MVRDSGRGTRRSPSARTAGGGADTALALALVKPRLVHHPVDAIATSTGARSDLDEVQYPGNARLGDVRIRGALRALSDAGDEEIPVPLADDPAGPGDHLARGR